MQKDRKKTINVSRDIVFVNLGYTSLTENNLLCELLDNCYFHRLLYTISHVEKTMFI